MPNYGGMHEDEFKRMDTGQAAIDRCDAGHWFIRSVIGDQSWSAPMMDCPWCKLDTLSKENDRLRNLAAGMFWSGGSFDDKTASEIVALGLDIRSRLDDYVKKAVEWQSKSEDLDDKLQAAQSRLGIAQEALELEHKNRLKEWDIIKELQSRLALARAAFRAADSGNDWCDGTKESWPVKSVLWLALEEALFNETIETCEHEWIDATNEVVTGTDYCAKCGKLRAHSERDVERQRPECPFCKTPDYVIRNEPPLFPSPGVFHCAACCTEWPLSE